VAINIGPGIGIGAGIGVGVTSNISGPAYTVLPVISGAAQVGQMLTVSTGTWNGTAPISYAYQWQHGTTDISGATTNTYVVEVAYVGETLQCIVTASNPIDTLSATSAATSAVVTPPVNSVAPTITGTAQVGQTLTCSTGTWSGGSITYTYQWAHTGSNIPGATSSTYVVEAAYLGENLRCTVTATNSVGFASAMTAATSAVVTLPINTVAPVISGTATQGQTLSVTTGTWTGGSVTYTYQWQQGTTNISGATSSTYVLDATYVGVTIRCVVTATNSVGSTTATSNATSAVLPLAPVNTVAPAITGTAAYGQTLTCSTGTWSNSPTSYTYQWQHTTTNISGATSSSYVVEAAYIGETIRCTVFAVNAGGTTTATSANTAAVLPDYPSNTVAPAITGTPLVGNTLSISTGTWVNGTSTYTYQWQHGTTDISGATSSSYVVEAAYIGETIRGVVTATNARGSTPATSTATAAVTSAPINTVLPAISGNATSGSVLTATTGTWIGTATITYAYQWQHGTTNISGATSSTYTISASYVGETIRCVVTAANGIGSVTATSAATSAVSTVPINTSAPQVSGTAQTGQTVTVTTGTWSNSPTSYTYQWQHTTTNISGATSSSYVVEAAYVGETLRCVVTATNAIGSTSANSSTTATVLPAAPVNTILPAITGTATYGQVLTCSTGTWSNSPTSYTYQWQHGTTDISGATTSTYTLDGSYVGETIRCVVIAVNAGGSSIGAISAATTAVLPDYPYALSLPVITGTPVVGNTLSVSNGTYRSDTTPTSYAYQWQHNNTNISGATTNTYVVESAYLGETLRCVVTATNARGSANGASSATAAVTSAPIRTVQPVVSGSTTVGSVLSCTTGTWIGTATITYAYQWKRAGVNISGATSSTYTTVSADAGNAISCFVTASNSIGSVSSASNNSITIALAAYPTVSAANELFKFNYNTLAASADLIIDNSSNGWPAGQARGSGGYSAISQVSGGAYSGGGYYYNNNATTGQSWIVACAGANYGTYHNTNIAQGSWAYETNIWLTNLSAINNQTSLTLFNGYPSSIVVSPVYDSTTQYTISVSMPISAPPVGTAMGINLNILPDLTGGAWHHLVIQHVYTSAAVGTFYVFVNGVVQTAGGVSYNQYSNYPGLAFWCDSANGAQLAGTRTYVQPGLNFRLDNTRLIIGAPFPTSGFTPPTSAFTA